MTQKSRKNSKTRWRRIRRLTKMQPYEKAYVHMGANGREFAVIKEDASMAPTHLPTLDQAQKAHDTLSRVVGVLKAGVPDAAATDALFNEIDSVLDLIGPPEPAGSAPTVGAPIGDLLKKVLKDLQDIGQEAQATDYATADKIDAVVESVQNIDAAIEAANKPAAPAVAVAPPTDAAPAVTPAVTPAVDPAAATQTPAVDVAPTTPAEPAPVVAAPATTPEAAPAVVAPEIVLPAAGKPGGFAAAPTGCPEAADGYADPLNFKHPIDTKERVQAAIAALANEEEAKAYTPAELEVMNARIATAAKTFGLEETATDGDATVGVTKADLAALGQSIVAGFAESLKSLVNVAKSADPIAPGATPAPATMQVPLFVAKQKPGEEYDPADEFDFAESPELAKMDRQGRIVK